MARRKNKIKPDDLLRYEPKCKVCNSHFKNIIENMYNEGLSARQILSYLSDLKDPVEQNIAIKENLKESNIQRHLRLHYNLKAAAKIQASATRSRIQKSRENFRAGVSMRVDSISTLSHLIDLALINIEDLDQFPDGRQKHQLTINYMGQIKSLIDEFSKLTGELKQEGTIDVNFFSDQITEFAQIVMATITKMDEKFKLDNQLLYEFGSEFKKQYQQYKEIQKKIVTGELPTNYGEKERSINTFNDANAILGQQGTVYQKPDEDFPDKDDPNRFNNDFNTSDDDDVSFEEDE